MSLVALFVHLTAAQQQSPSPSIVETNTSQALAELKYKKVDVDWTCDDSSWTVTVDPSGGYEEVNGGASLSFMVTITVPSDAVAGTTCTASVQADEVSPHK